MKGRTYLMLVGGVCRFPLQLVEATAIRRARRMIHTGWLMQYNVPQRASPVKTFVCDGALARADRQGYIDLNYCTSGEVVPGR
jgi:hypothetical protein